MTSSPRVWIRDFRDEDVPAANALTNHFIEHTSVHFALTPATDEAFREAWAEAQPAWPWIVAEVQGHFAGYCKASAWRTRAAYAKTAETGLYVEESARGQGIGQMLYLAMLHRLKRMGFRTVVAGVALPNPASERLHEAMGFRQVGVFHAVGYKFDTWHDVAWWERDLASLTPLPDGPTTAPRGRS